jgi:lipid II:glycine glycyltransferase (peptidoglycan interpeptide bridge formation enzyme)
LAKLSGGTSNIKSVGIFENRIYHDKKLSDQLQTLMNGSTAKGRHEFATNLVVWEGILEGKRRGCRWFDFDGVRDERYRYTKDENWEGVTRFKVGFGGEEVTYLGAYIKRLPFLKARQ